MYHKSKRRFIGRSNWEQWGIRPNFEMNLFNYWRLVYTLRGDRVEVLCIVLDLVDHPAYDKIFGYKKR